jgi:alpha-beta hydrolase superfamily lysophospholipase
MNFTRNNYNRSAQEEMLMLRTKDDLELFTQDWTVSNPKAIVVLTPGYNDHSGRFSHVGQTLNAAGYSLYSYDLRGNGHSGGQRGHTPGYDYLLDDLGLVIDAARQAAPSTKLFVYGHSLGGNITINYASRRPAGLSGVIATGPWLKLATEPPALQVGLMRVLNVVLPTASVKSGINVAGLSRDEKVGAAYLADPLLHGLITPRLALAASDNGLAALAQAGALKLPLLLLHGAADPITSPAASEAFFQSVGSTDKTLKLFPDMRHEIHNEFGREDVFATITAWLDQHC